MYKQPEALSDLYHLCMEIALRHSLCVIPRVVAEFFMIVSINFCLILLFEWVGIRKIMLESEKGRTRRVLEIFIEFIFKLLIIS